MTEIERKALALVNEIERQEGLSDLTPRIMRGLVMDEALCRAIEQHEAFKREVSDAVEAVFAGYHDAPIPWVVMRRKLEPFIIAKPDPLVEALSEIDHAAMRPDECAKELRAALAKHGLKLERIEHE